MEKQNQYQRENNSGMPGNTGKSLFFGAAVGVIAGWLLLGNPTLGMGIGAVIGLIGGITKNAPGQRAG